MKLLLDTHVVLWALSEPRRLSAQARTSMSKSSVELAVSAATVWEVAIKARLGKLRLPGSAAAWLIPAVDELGVQWLDVTAAHAATVESLPLHHRDPFDRLLVAQAMGGGWTIVTADDAFVDFGVPLMRT
jgi:PIN domain nuclease of toxin-antitoxin system